MAREPEGYRDNIEIIMKQYGHNMLTVQEAAIITNTNPKKVTQRYGPWSQEGRAKKINVTALARQMCNYK